METAERSDGTREGAAEGRADAGSTVRLPAPRLARGILLAMLLSYVHVITINVLGEDLTGTQKGWNLAGLAVNAVLQYCHSTPWIQRRLGRLKYLTLGCQGILSYLPVVLLHDWWGSMAGFFAGSLLLLLPPRVAWTLYGVLGVGMFAGPLLSGQAWDMSIYFSQSSLLCGITVYGLTHLSRVIHELHETRDELARMAVAQERLRFARDLHDLLGYSLSSITLKTELIRRLIHVQPEQAVDEVAEVLTISRQSLADVRTVASGYREMSLEQEVASARSVLGAAEVDVRIDFSLGPVDRQVDTVLATVLREAVTNLLRHSRATHCAITVTRFHDARVRLAVVNDGADPGHRDASPDSGSGLGNLATRLEAIGGRLTFGHADDGTFRLTAEAPAGGGAGQRALRDAEFAAGGPGA
ncbi:histidine kinase [Streptomyces sp. NPDC049577]|uniref:sensor histidine kinase n=1 Tax=Streptomyces sp. NPDC049577 TaxID=3155153 RepID=UPI00343EA982